MLKNLEWTTTKTSEVVKCQDHKNKMLMLKRIQWTQVLVFSINSTNEELRKQNRDKWWISMSSFHSWLNAWVKSKKEIEIQQVKMSLRKFLWLKLMINIARKWMMVRWRLQLVRCASLILRKEVRIWFYIADICSILTA